MASDPCATCLHFDTSKPHASSTNLTLLNAAAPPPTSPTPFLTKTYELVDDPDTNSVISWSNEGNSFVVWNPADLCRRLLPRYFKHSNFASFVRQLNTYGFHKIAPDQWEFANVEFQRGQRQLLRGIHRRRSSATARSPGFLQADRSCSSSIMFSSGSKVEISSFNDEDEKESLMKDKNELMRELLSLRQKFQSTMGDLHTMWKRLQTAETCQHHMISFIYKAINNPDFLAQIRQHSSTVAETANMVSEKRQVVDADQSAAMSSINHFCNNASHAGLHAGNYIVSNPHSQQYQTDVKSLETELSTQAKANWNDQMRSVGRAPLQTLDELVADAKRMASTTMNSNKAPYSRSFSTECQYRRIDASPAQGYGHFTVGDTRSTYNAPSDRTYNVVNPSNRGSVHLNGGLESSTPPQEEARCPLRRPCSNRDVQAAPSYQYDT